MGTFGTLGRCAAILVLAVFGVVAAFATIPPSREAPLPAPTPLVEALPLHARELPGPASYIREDQFRRGDTLAALLARLGIAELEAQRLARLRALRPRGAREARRAYRRAGTGPPGYRKPGRAARGHAEVALRRAASVPGAEPRARAGWWRTRPSRRRRRGRGLPRNGRASRTFPWIG